MRTVKMALDVAVLVVKNGGSTVSAADSFAKILKGYKESGVAAVWRLDFIAATLESEHSTILRPVGPIGVNLVRAAELANLSDRVASGEVPFASFGAELERIKDLSEPYGRWATIGAAAFTAAFFSQIPGGDWGSFAIAFVAGGVGQLFRSLLQARKLTVALLTMICGCISAGIACAGLRMGFTETAAAALIGSVIYLVPGLPLINGCLDVISHKYLLMGIERILNAVFLILVIAIAIAFAFVTII